MALNKIAAENQNKPKQNNILKTHQHSCGMGCFHNGSGILLVESKFLDVKRHTDTSSRQVN